MTTVVAVLIVFAEAALCRMMSAPIARDPRLTVLLVTAQTETLATVAGSGPGGYGSEIMSRSNPPGLRPPPSSQARVYGQLVTVNRLAGAGADAIRDRLARGVVLVPWGYQADCSPILWDT